MSPEAQPIYLLADSQLLFWQNGDARLLESIARRAQATALRAAYIGASNGDAPEYYDIFVAAVSAVGVNDCRMIRSSFSSEDEAFLNGADIVLLAGGDVAAGWKIIDETGMKDAVISRYHAGATIIGVSAGAVQLGMYGLSEERDVTATLLETFKLCPFVIGAHDEGDDWRSLTNVVRMLEGSVQGVGIPAGGGVVYHPNGELEPVRKAAHHVLLRGREVVTSILLPSRH